MIIKQKTSFVSESPIIIHDNRGFFYSCPKDIRFNLPEGEYKIKGRIRELRQYIENKGPSLPPYEKTEFDIGHFIKNVNIVTQTNPNKASVKINENLIVLDTTLSKTLLTHELVFILLHEIGHTKYFKEEYCDLFAAKMMLNYGFNYSQVAMSLKKLLADKGRIKYGINKLDLVCCKKEND